jgi:hypothetical protein
MKSISPWVLLRVLPAVFSLSAGIFLTACQPQTVRETIVETQPELINRRVMVPVDDKYTDPLPCDESVPATIREHIVRGETNTAQCKIANVHRAEVRRKHRKPDK